MAKKNKKIKKNIKVKKAKSKLVESKEVVHKTRIRVIGIGGGGSSIVAEISPFIKKVDFLAVNTDVQALKEVGRKARIFQFGQNLTHGLGCGMDPKIGQKAARDAKQKIANLLKGVDFAILVSSLGGGTGSGAAPEFARIARELGVMTFGIFTLPFKFEGIKRAQIARSSLEKLIPNLNALSIIPNENIFQIINKDTPIIEAFSSVNKRMAENLRGLVEMIYFPGIVNIDFADLKTILDGKGKLAYLNSVNNQGDNRAEEALKELLKSPLNEYGIDGAEKILFNVTASKDLSMKEVELISKGISDFNRRAKIIFGVSQDNAYNGKLRITLLAVGCCKEKDTEKKAEPKPEPEKPAPESEPRKKQKPKKSVKRTKKNKVRKKRPRKASKIDVLPAAGRVKRAESFQVPVLIESVPLARKNGLDLKKEAEKTEEELLSQEEKWDVPAFLRREASQ